MSEGLTAPTASGWGNLLRFLASGGINTLATWALYVALLQVLPYRWSYTIAYLAGIALAYLLYRYFVFRQMGRRFAPVWVGVVYLFQYLLGLLLVHVWVRILLQPQLWAPIFAVAVSLPLTYALNRWVFRPGDSSGLRSTRAPDQ
jgi:putative flippase GtrA